MLVEGFHFLGMAVSESFNCSYFFLGDFPFSLEIGSYCVPVVEGATAGNVPLPLMCHVSMMMTHLVWMGHILGSSEVPTEYASMASSSILIAGAWN